MSDNEANLADLLALVAGAELSSIKKRDIASAIRMVAKVLGAAPEDLPLDTLLLRRGLEEVQPESLGISRARWNNIRALLNRALELKTELMPSVQKNPISADWQVLIADLPKAGRHRLGALLRYLSAKSIGPADLTFAHLEEFHVAITTNRLRRSPERTWDLIAWYWNGLVAKMPRWPQVVIPREDKRVRYIRGWDAFPASFEADVRAYLKVLAGTEISEDGPVRPLRPVSLAEREYQLRGAASALAATGVPPETICSITDIARLEPMKLILDNILKRGEGEHWMGVLGMAKTLRAAAKHWVKVDAEEQLKIEKLVGRLPRQQGGLTDKNRERLRSFDDPKFVKAFLDLPHQLARDLKAKSKKKTVVDAVAAQIIVAIALLQVVPIRMRNLAGLDLEKHLLERGGRIYLEIPRSEVKNDRPLQLELPGDVVDLVSWYCVEYRDLLIEAPTNALFPGEGGAPKKRKGFGMQIARMTRKHLGHQINPHLFRHIAAKLYLDKNPGQYATVSRLLGHRTLATTMQAYTGAETVSASRHYQNLVRGLRDNTAQLSKGLGKKKLSKKAGAK